MSPAVTFLLITFATGIVLAGLFAIGAARQSSYLSREEEDGPHGHLYREGGWLKTTDDPGDER